MFIERIFIYPTCDIHLLRTAGADMQIEVWGIDNDGNLHDVTSSANTKFLNFDPAVVNSNGKGKFSPLAEGVTIGRIQHTDISDSAEIITVEVLVRIVVHNGIEQLWIGNNRASIHAGESNYVLSVFAKFSDGMIGDVSSHPYLDFSSANPTALSINNINDKGRLTGINSGAPAVALTVSHNGKTDTINGFVRDSLKVNRPILKRIHGTGKYSDRRNILILPEGFTGNQSDKDLFERVTQEIKHNFFDTNTHTPYDILKDKFNLWVAFESCPEPGVTIENPVATDGTPIPSGNTDAGACDPKTMTLEALIEFVGLPDANAPATFTEITTKWGGITGLNLSRVSNDLFDLWKKQVIAGITQAKDSFFGLAIGARFGERFSENEITPQVKMNKWFANSSSARHMVPDSRRMPKVVDGANYAVTRLSLLNKYLNSLRFGTDQADPNFEVYKIWADFANDWKFIGFILNDRSYGGTNFGAFATSLGSSTTVPIFNLPGHPLKLDHVPDFVAASMDVSEIDPLRLTHAVGHEIAHSMQLGDEYDGYDDPAHTSFTNTEKNKARVTPFLNLTHFFEVANTATNKLIGDRIKWNWHRIKQVALLITTAADSGTDKVNIRLNPGEGAKWQDAKSKNEKVFLRVAGMNIDVDRTKGIDGPFTISAITPDSSGDLVQLKGRTTTVNPQKYPKGSILFLPLKDNAGNILMTVDPKVIAHINSTGEPFHKSTDCASCHTGASFPPKNIPGLKYPPNQFEVIGLYEGGATFNCRVFRPSGMCQMRDDYFKDEKNLRLSTFSFIAKYVIVNQIDPLQLPKLNPLYPSG